MKTTQLRRISKPNRFSLYRLDPAHRLHAVCLWACFGMVMASNAAPKIVLNESDFRDRVYACWLGKNIGGTLGMPFEGKKEPNNVSFYSNLKTGEPSANDDLDLQILWLQAMEENGGRVDARILGEYWLKYVPVDWNEYGIGKTNMRMGLLPPLSGEVNNEKWKHSNGAWIRSEIWACLAPGNPALAARMAREDACVDHGAAEGTLAEMFTAALESAAFVESDRDQLIAFGLSMIPAECRVAKAVRTAVEAKYARKTWQEARLDVIRNTEDTGWFQAPRNIAFMLIGWLYGDRDFGKSICTAVNCGDDTDCTGATLGSILGIIGGTKSIPNKWRKPIGDRIKTVAVTGIPIPENIGALTEKTMAMAKKVLALNQAPVVIEDTRTDLTGAVQELRESPRRVRSLWNRSPYQIVWTEPDLMVTLDYLAHPVIKPNVPRSIRVVLQNPSTLEKSLHFQLDGLPEGWNCSGLPTKTFRLKGNSLQEFEMIFLASRIKPEANAMEVKVTGGSKPISIPLTLMDAEKQ